MLNELIQRHAYDNNSNTIPLTPRQVKTRQDKAREDEIYIDSLHIIIMKMTMSIIMSMTMTIIIQ